MRTLFIRCAVGTFSLSLVAAAEVLAQGGPPPVPPGGEARGGGAPIPEELVVDVECPGDSISDALAQPAVTLTINVDGECNENVQIARDNVTLRGANGDPAVDKIVGIETEVVAPHFGIVLLITGAANVVVEDLTIRNGALWGVGVTGFGVSEAVRIENCVISDNAFWGLVVFRGRGSATQIVFSNNGSESSGRLRGGAARVTRYSSFNLNSCTLDATLPDPSATSVTDLLTALNVDAYSTVTVRNRDGVAGLLEGATSLSASTGSSVSLRGERVDGVVVKALDVAGRFSVQRKARLELRDVTQGDLLTSSNNVSSDSILDASRGRTTLSRTVIDSFSNANLRDVTFESPNGDLFVDRFSQAIISGGTTTIHTLSCSAGSDALCEFPSATDLGVGTMTGCSLCTQ